MSLPVFPIGDTLLDSLDLKVSLLGNGVQAADSFYEEFEPQYRLSRHPHACNTMFVGDHLPVYLARTKQSPFQLTASGGKPVLTYNGAFVADVDFPPPTKLFAQKTSGGIPFGQLAVMQGDDMLAFSYLWACELAKSQNQCRFCHCGNFTNAMVQAKQWQDFNYPVPDIVDVIQYAVEEDPHAEFLQLTAGSTFNPDAEIDRYTAILRETDKRVGLNKLTDSILYLTPPKDVKKLDKLIDAGAGWLAFDLDLWDENLFAQFCPGKAKFTTHRQHRDALLYIADKYGKNRACSVLVAGLEPLDRTLDGFSFLAEHGIVPLPSPWMPVGVANPDLPPVPDLEYYRTLRKETAKLYIKYGLTVPGTTGSAVCLSRDIYLRREQLV